MKKEIDLCQKHRSALISSFVDDDDGYDPHYHGYDD